MSTGTETKVTVVIQPEITKAVRASVDAANKADSLFVVISRTARTVADRHGWEQSDARQAICLSYQEVFGIPLEKQEILEGDDEDTKTRKRENNTKIADFLKAKAPDISKITTLAYPANPQAQLGIKGIIAFNESLPKGTIKGRVGVNKMLEVARGNLLWSEETQSVIEPPKSEPTITTPAPSTPTSEPEKGEEGGVATLQQPTVAEQERAETAAVMAEEKRQNGGIGTGPLSPADLFESAAIANKKQGLTADEALAIVRRVWEIKG